MAELHGQFPGDDPYIPPIPEGITTDGFEHITRLNRAEIDIFDPSAYRSSYDVALWPDGQDYRNSPDQAPWLLRARQRIMLDRLGIGLGPLPEDRLHDEFDIEYTNGTHAQLKIVSRADGVSIPVRTTYRPFDRGEAIESIVLLSYDAATAYTEEMGRSAELPTLDHPKQNLQTAASWRMRALKGWDVYEWLPGHENMTESRQRLARLILPGARRPRGESKWKLDGAAVTYGLEMTLEADAQGFDDNQKQLFQSEEQAQRLRMLDEQVRYRRVGVYLGGLAASGVAAVHGALLGMGAGEAMEMLRGARVNMEYLKYAAGAYAVGVFGLSPILHHQSTKLEKFWELRDRPGLETFQDQLESELKLAEQYRRGLPGLPWPSSRV